MGNCISIDTAQADAWPGPNGAMLRLGTAPGAAAKGAAAAPPGAALLAAWQRITGGRLRDSAHSFGLAAAKRKHGKRARGGARRAVAAGAGAGPGGATGAALAALARACGAAQEQLRLPAVDIATGDLLPDFGVDGIFDVLQLLGEVGRLP
jgi:hypothetical protein